MATKAQRFRSEQERNAGASKPKKKIRRPRARANDVDTSQPGVSATDRRAGGGRSGARNVSKRAERKGGARLEDSETGKASRKSTRKSAGRVKPSSNLQRRAIRKSASPQARAARAAVRN
jgi:hypothetical protein